jgi:hypothetical protein
MSIATEITRIENAANIIKAKTNHMGLEKSPGVVVSTSDNLTVQASVIDAIPERDAVSQTLNASTTSINLSAGYYGSESSVSVAIMEPQVVALSGSQQTISCSDKLMTGDITIPAANVYRTGSGIPTNATPGNDGDLYLVV